MSAVKPRIGISACLLGQNVRYDGEHKRQDWLVDCLGPWVTWVPVCPEMEMGLGTPRQAMRLSGSPKSVRLVTVNTGTDLTELARRTFGKLVSGEKLEDLDAFILKKNSPSCGLERVKIYGRGGVPGATGPGLFALELVARFPGLPAIEEGRLTDPEQKERFLTLLFGRARLRRLPARTSELQKFHQSYKLLLMAHSPVHYRELGKIAANPSNRPARELIAQYGSKFLEAFEHKATARKRANVLQHIFGYFSDRLERKERLLVLETIENTRQGTLPFIAGLTLVHHLARKFGITYLEGQVLFEPFPRELLSCA